MAISIPIISEFNGAGIQKAVKQFQQLETAGQKAQFILKNAAKAAALGFAALGTAVAGAAVVGYKFAQMAMEDQAAQKRLALALKASTKATDADIAAREKWIDTTARAYGVADDKLRPAFARLVRSTKDADKAQRLLNLALNISAATSKPLEAVTNSLARAQDGQLAGLLRLGVGLDKASIKGKTLADVQKTLEQNFAGAAQATANTYEGRMARLKVTVDELKESLGAKLIPIFDKIAQAVLRIADAFGEKGLKGAVKQLGMEMNALFYNADGSLNSFGESLNKLISVINLGAGGGKLFEILKNAVTFGEKGGVNRLKESVSQFAGGNFGIAGLAPAVSQQTLGRNILGNVRYGQNQGVNININMGVGDPVAVGRQVANVIRQYDRRTGGK